MSSVNDETQFGTEIVMEAMEPEVARLEGLRRATVGMLCARGALVPIEVSGRVALVRSVEGHEVDHDLCQRWGMVPVP